MILIETYLKRDQYLTIIVPIKYIKIIKQLAKLEHSILIIIVYLIATFFDILWSH